MNQHEWDAEADTFDDEPDHGLRDPSTRAAWRDLLLEVLPTTPATVADLGCGTGTMTQLLTDEGYVVDGLDYSPEMLRLARAKVPSARFVLGDAAAPQLPAASYDVVFSRHVLWAMADPDVAFERWVDLLKPHGTVVLVEGNWSTGAGLSAEEATRIVSATGAEAVVRHLNDPIFWGKPISDERYLLVSSR